MSVDERQRLEDVLTTYDPITHGLTRELLAGLSGDDAEFIAGIARNEIVGTIEGNLAIAAVRDKMRTLDLVTPDEEAKIEFDWFIHGGASEADERRLRAIDDLFAVPRFPIKDSYIDELHDLGKRSAEERQEIMRACGLTGRVENSLMEARMALIDLAVEQFFDPDLEQEMSRLR